MELDRIYCADAHRLREVDDASVQLIITSPPYNVGKNYSQHQDLLGLREYLGFLEGVWQECMRVLVPGGRLAVNIANTFRKPYLPLNTYITQQLIEMGYLMRGEIIWDKAASAGTSTAWGSFARASNPTLRDVHEYILVFSKDSFKLEDTRGKTSGIENLEFVEWTKSVWHSPADEVEDSEKTIWRFDTTSKRRRRKQAFKINHPAPFPLDLPLRLILLYTNIGDIVLDPFIGSGTTALAAKMTQRHFIGYDISEEYIAEAKARLATLEQPELIEELHGLQNARKKQSA